MDNFEQARKAMVKGQIMPNGVRKVSILESMLNIPREAFVPDAYKKIAYSGREIPLDHGRALLEPTVLAKIIDAADIEPGNNVLDIACGTGYSSALLASLGAKVVALENAPELVEQMTNAFEEARIKGFEVSFCELVIGDITKGVAEKGPFNVILINGAVEKMPPALKEQLALKGRLIAIYHEGFIGRVRMIRRMSEDQYETKTLFECTANKLQEFSLKAGFSL